MPKEVDSGIQTPNEDGKEPEFATYQDEINWLRKQLEFFQKDGLEGSLYALNYQLNKINEIILQANITLSGNDRQFERFWKFMTEIQSVHTSIVNLRNMLYPNKKNDEEKKSLNFMENKAFE